MSRQVILVGAPRSGAGLLAALLTGPNGWRHSRLSTMHPIDAVPGCSVEEREFASHRLTRADATPSVIDAILNASVPEDDDSDHDTGGGAPIVDWNPRLSMRVGLLAQALPDARFVLVVRRPIPAISSLMDAWRSRRFESIPDLPGWWGEPWAFPLTEDWREVIGAPPARVCATQWAQITTDVLDDLADLPDDRWIVASYEALIADPEQEIQRIASELGEPWHGEIPDVLPLTASTVTPPRPGKWQHNISEISATLAEIEPVIQRLKEQAAARRPALHWPELEQPKKDEPTVRTIASEGTPFSSSHTTTMAQLLEQAQVSLVISTYKSGHVIVARNDDGKINTEFTTVNRPMGVAVAGSRLAIGAVDSILTFTANAGVAQNVPSTKPVDLAYAPRSIVFTGDVQIHDMAYGQDGVLYFINTRFSCLCRQDIDYSFEPIWRPAWITGLAAEDRCHLNGLAVVDGVPKYVTALSQTDTPAGWRELKGTSGAIIDITTNDVIAQGLSMPHSPRWYDNKLWVLESGTGTLNTVDASTGEKTIVATLPGFTRGLTFIGPYALVGLSQVRESVFSSLPITEQATERNCGVWAVDTRTGQITGFIRFAGVVQEIFDVHVLPGTWPAIVNPGDLTINAFVLSDQALTQVAQPATRH